MLPGISKAQMVEVDRIMTEEMGISVELMMENAGLSLARLAAQERASQETHFIFHVIAGSGNNGGGGIVAARRLVAWGLPTTIFLPNGISRLRPVPQAQLLRAQQIGIPIYEILPSELSSNHPSSITLDCYIGYGYQARNDPISAEVFQYLKDTPNVISLDAPSGLDVTTGEDYSQIHPILTLTIAFVKSGMLKSAPESLGDLFLCDIGVPAEIFKSKLGIEWKLPHESSSLARLSQAFQRDSLVGVDITRTSEGSWWDVRT